MVLKREVFWERFPAGVTDMFRFGKVVGSVGPHVYLGNQQLADRTFQQDDHSVFTVLGLCHPTSAKWEHQPKRQNTKLSTSCSAAVCAVCPHTAFITEQQHLICHVFIWFLTSSSSSWARNQRNLISIYIFYLSVFAKGRHNWTIYNVELLSFSTEYTAHKICLSG